MLTRTLLAATAVAVLAGVAHAQPAAAPQVVQEAPAPLDEAAFEARADRFDAQVDQMSRELDAAVRANTGDRAATLAAVDEILARYRPEIEGFADDFDAFIAGQAAQAADDPEALAQLNAARDSAIPVIRSIPDQIRAGLIQNLDAPAPDAAPTQ
ncbi:MAG: translation initiation factor IF-2 [Brevundimonas sp.]|uniref:translation initiation factor IF-2 n=1 Tax=Brevundimonas sp. TaxID=1871086 RepID=UPI003918BA54